MHAFYTYCKNGAHGNAVGDFWALGDGWKITKNRNKASTATTSVSLRAIAAWCKQYNFDVRRFFTPLISTVQIIDRDGYPIFEGALTSTPAFSLEDIDAKVDLEFGDAIWMLSNDVVVPIASYNQSLDSMIKQEITNAIARSNKPSNITPWFITIGAHWDALAVVQNTVDSVKNLQDFVLERTNNTQGAGQFDIYADANSGIECWKNLGNDTSNSVTIEYPDRGQRGGAQKLDFAAWSNYWSDIFMSGAGNGYGAGGGTITSAKCNTAANANTGYSRRSAQNSSVSAQATLDAQASGYLAWTAKAFSTPTAQINAELFEIRDHRDGGDLWVGDTVGVHISDNFAQFLPIETYTKLRVNAIELDYDQEARATATISFVDPTPDLGSQ